MGNFACTPLHPCFDPGTGKCDCDPEIASNIDSGETLMKVVVNMSEKDRLAYFERIFEYNSK